MSAKGHYTATCGAQLGFVICFNDWSKYFFIKGILKMYLLMMGRKCRRYVANMRLDMSTHK